MPITVSSRRVALLTVFALSLSGFAGAQAPSDFSGRLSWVPISGGQRADVGGSGRITANLERSQLTISGSFSDMPAAAVAASLREGVATGARGPVIADLTVSHADSGSISGEVRLNRSQIAALREGRLYVQVHAERGVEPDNAVLWGWLLAEETSR